MHLGETAGWLGPTSGDCGALVVPEFKEPARSVAPLASIAMVTALGCAALGDGHHHAGLSVKPAGPVI
jgi:hypothetical protein